MHQYPDTLFVSDATGPDMVRAGEPRLRHYSRPSGDGLLLAAVARFWSGLRLPGLLQVTPSR